MRVRSTATASRWAPTSKDGAKPAKCAGLPGLLFLRSPSIRHPEHRTRGSPRQRCYEDSGHKSCSIFARYSIVDQATLDDTGQKVEEYLRTRRQERAAKLRRESNWKSHKNHYSASRISRKSLVRAIGLEPTLPCGNWNLNPARLPVSPRPRVAPEIISSLNLNAKYFFSFPRRGRGRKRQSRPRN